MAKSHPAPLIDRLEHQARLLRVARKALDHRSVTARLYRDLADLLDEALMYIAGVEASRRLKRKRR